MNYKVKIMASNSPKELFIKQQVNPSKPAQRS